MRAEENLLFTQIGVRGLNWVPHTACLGPSSWPPHRVAGDKGQAVSSEMPCPHGFSGFWEAGRLAPGARPHPCRPHLACTPCSQGLARDGDDRLAPGSSLTSVASGGPAQPALSQDTADYPALAGWQGRSHTTDGPRP